MSCVVCGADTDDATVGVMCEPHAHLLSRGYVFLVGVVPPAHVDLKSKKTTRQDAPMWRRTGQYISMNEHAAKTLYAKVFRAGLGRYEQVAYTDGQGMAKAIKCPYISLCKEVVTE